MVRMLTTDSQANKIFAGQLIIFTEREGNIHYDDIGITENGE